MVASLLLVLVLLNKCGSTLGHTPSTSEVLLMVILLSRTLVTSAAAASLILVWLVVAIWLYVRPRHPSALLVVTRILNTLVCS